MMSTLPKSKAQYKIPISCWNWFVKLSLNKFFQQNDVDFGTVIDSNYSFSIIYVFENLAEIYFSNLGFQKLVESNLMVMEFLKSYYWGLT